MRLKLNKFENVRGGGGEIGAGVSLYCEFQCIMGNDYMGPPVDRLTGLKTLPLPLCQWAVIRHSYESPKI